jgi:hypothetical protein
MTPDEIERRLRALESRTIRGVGVSSAFGGIEIRATQVGFPVILTGPFVATPGPTAGYPWAQLVVDNTVPGVETQYAPRSGFNAYTPDNNTTLDSGVRGWLEISPQANGWVFTADASAGDANGCVVTNVCPQFSSGVIVGMIVEKTCPDGSKTCYLNPIDCCAVSPPPVLCPQLCGAVAIPATLYATKISGCTVGPDSGCNAVYPLVYQPLLGGMWSGGCSAGNLLIELLCNEATGQVVYECFNSFNQVPSVLDITSCDPFCATVTLTNLGENCCEDSGVWQISSDPSGTCGNPTSWTCDQLTGDCTEISGSSGFATKALCLAACPGVPITYTPLGEWKGVGASLSSSSITVPGNSELVIGFSGTCSGLTFNGVPLTPVLASTSGASKLYATKVASTTTGVITANFGASVGMVIQALYVTGLTNFAVDKTSSGTDAGTTSQPTIAAYGPTVIGKEFWVNLVTVTDASTPTIGTPSSPFTGTGQDQILSTTGGKIGQCMAYDIASTTGSPNPTYTEATQTAWEGISLTLS